jgi:predicted alpha-1,6-mannanase (GH76 family)
LTPLAEKSSFSQVWWSSKRHYKNAITNELAVSNAAVLHKATGEQRYLDQALAQWSWFNSSGMLNHKTGAICDGLGINAHTFKCSGSGGTSYTYNQGVIIGGLSHLYDITKDQSLLDSAHVIANGTMALYTTRGGISRRR